MNCPKVFIIILNWNGLQDTLECLESVYKLDYPNFEVIVVDNGSSDESVAAISTNYPKVTLIVNKENLGFEGGNNVGIRYALEQNYDCCSQGPGEYFLEETELMRGINVSRVTKLHSISQKPINLAVV